jgi:hypothetical protein
MDSEPNPFAVLSLIVAPAILTNASSVLVMSTSNRLARAVDRARELSKQLEEGKRLGSADAEAERRLEELKATEQRALLLLKGLRCFYASLGAFASATLISLVGAVLAPLDAGRLVEAIELAAVAAGLFAVSGISYGSVLLMRETKLAVQTLSRRIKRLQQNTPQ